MRENSDDKAQQYPKAEGLRQFTAWAWNIHRMEIMEVQRVFLLCQVETVKFPEDESKKEEIASNKSVVIFTTGMSIELDNNNDKECIQGFRLWTKALTDKDHVSPLMQPCKVDYQFICGTAATVLSSVWRLIELFSATGLNRKLSVCHSFPIPCLWQFKLTWKFIGQHRIPIMTSNFHWRSEVTVRSTFTMAIFKLLLGNNIATKQYCQAIILPTKIGNITCWASLGLLKQL